MPNPDTIEGHTIEEWVKMCQEAEDSRNAMEATLDRIRAVMDSLPDVGRLAWGYPNWEEVYERLVRNLRAALRGTED